MAEPTRRRAARIDVQRAREAVRLVAPINRQIGPWQSTAARLVALGEKLRKTGGFEPRLLAEAEALSKTVETQQRLLDSQVRDLGPELAGHSRFHDTVRALQTVASGAQRALTLLRPGSPAH